MERGWKGRVQKTRSKAEALGAKPLWPSVAPLETADHLSLFSFAAKALWHRRLAPPQMSYASQGLQLRGSTLISSQLPYQPYQKANPLLLRAQMSNGPISFFLGNTKAVIHIFLKKEAEWILRHLTTTFKRKFKTYTLDLRFF